MTHLQNRVFKLLQLRSVKVYNFRQRFVQVLNLIKLL